jgi:hypothetical protein
MFRLALSEPLLERHLPPLVRAELALLAPHARLMPMTLPVRRVVPIHVLRRRANLSRQLRFGAT